MKRRRGFTLIEVLLAVLIAGVLGAVAVTKFSGSGDRANNSKMAQNVRTVAVALEAYAAENNGRFPAELNSPGFIDRRYLDDNQLPIAPWCTLPQTNVASFNAINSGLDVWADLKNSARRQTSPDAWPAGVKVAAIANPPGTWNNPGLLRYNPKNPSDPHVYYLYGIGKLDTKTIVVNPISNSTN